MKTTEPTIKEKKRARIDWLKARPKLWEGYPWGYNLNNSNERLEKKNREKEIIDQMKAEGLISQKSNWYDMPFNNWIIQVRKEIREEKIKAGKL